jgi:hypothetical protein
VPSRQVYEADREIIEACRARGVEISPRQLERWRALLPAREVKRVEGVRGSRTVNPAGYVDQVIAISETLRAGIPLREVPLVLFVRRMPVRVEVLRAAYLDVFTRVAQELQRPATKQEGGAGDPEDRVDAMATYMARRARSNPMGRRWEARARQAVRRREVEAGNAQSLLSGALSAAFTGPMTGRQATREGIAEALTVFGLDDGQDPQNLAQFLATLNFNATIEAIRSASLEGWIAARDDLADMLKFGAVRQRVQSRLPLVEQPLPGLNDFLSEDPVSQAMQIPGLLIAVNDEWRQAIREQLAQWEAVDSLLSALPERFHQPLLQDRLSDELRQELAPLAQAWAQENPNKARLLGAVTSSLSVLTRAQVGGVRASQSRVLP